MLNSKQEEEEASGGPSESSSEPNALSDVINSVTQPLRKNWLLKDLVDTDTFSDTSGTEESLPTDEEDLPLSKPRSRKRKVLRDVDHKPTLADLQLVGDILFTETPTHVGFSGDEQKEILLIGDVGALDSQGRNALFEKGIEFERKGKPGLALQCYLACIQGLDGQVEQFPQLPLCLRYIARLYFAEEQYEKAVHFVQAEKLYYETALLASEGSDSPERKPDDLKAMMVARAAEFEQLSDMCLQNKNVGLALDYIGKAVKINEAVHGKDDPLTRRSRDKFSYIYAEEGKIQYNDALARFQRKASIAPKTSPIPAELETEAPFTPEQSLTQKIFSLSLLILFLIIIIIEVTLVILSFSKGYLYIPTYSEVTNALSYLVYKLRGTAPIEL